jgi:membrane protease YdiL (CAAX protease family)
VIAAPRLQADPRARPRPGLDEVLAWSAVGMACVALATRQVGDAALAVTAGVGVVGVAVPSGHGRERPIEWSGWLIAVVLGVGAFTGARLLVVLPPQAPHLYPLFGNVVAAFAEEALFRRLLFGRLLRWGAAAAIVGSAVVFAVVHLPAYGSWAFAVDLAAGLVFGWQRWVTRSWVAPGVTHAVANVLQML